MQFLLSIKEIKKSDAKGVSREGAKFRNGTRERVQETMLTIKALRKLRGELKVVRIVYCGTNS